MRIVRVSAFILLLSGVTGVASDFLTEGVDNARTGWVRDEKIFNKTNVTSMKLLWKVNLESTPRAMHNLFAPLVAERVNTAQGPRELAVVAGVSDDLYGIDVAAGRQIWHRRFDSTLANPGGTNDTLCPGGQTAVPTMTQASPGRYTVYAVSWDGRLRQVNLADGQDIAPPEKFIPGGGKPYALNLHHGVDLHRHRAGLWRPDQRVLLVRPRHAPCERVHPGGRGPVGTPRRGDRSGRQGLPRNRRRAVRPGDAPPRQRHRRGEARRQQTAAAHRLLRRAQRELAVAARPGRQHDADGGRLPRPEVPGRHEQGVPAVAAGSRGTGRGGPPDDAPDHTADLQRRAGVRCEGHLGRVECLAGREGHAMGDRAVLGTGEPDVQGADRARPPDGRRRRGVQLEERAGKWQLTPAWLSRDMDLAEEAVIANGVVFTYAAGEDASQVMPDRAWDESGGPVYGGGLSSGPGRRVRIHAGPRSTRSTVRPGRNCGRAATRLNRGITSAGSPLRTAARTSPRSTAASIASASPGRPIQQSWLPPPGGSRRTRCALDV